MARGISTEVDIGGKQHSFTTNLENNFLIKILKVPFSPDRLNISGKYCSHNNAEPIYLLHPRT